MPNQSVSRFTATFWDLRLPIRIGGWEREQKLALELARTLGDDAPEA